MYLFPYHSHRCVAHIQLTFAYFKEREEHEPLEEEDQEEEKEEEKKKEKEKTDMKDLANKVNEIQGLYLHTNLNAPDRRVMYK